MGTNVERHRAIVKIPYEFLRGILFPEGTKILAIIDDPDNILGAENILCKIEHPNLPITKEGENYPVVEPSYFI